MNNTVRSSLFAILALTVGVVAGYIAYPQFLDHSQTKFAEQRLSAVTARASEEHDMFVDLTNSHVRARRAFQNRYNSLSEDEVQESFATFFPVHHTQTRRSRDEDFERSDSAGDVYGMGAFIGALDPEASFKRAAVAGYLTVREFGPAQYPQFSSLYFINDGNLLTIFAPDREDNLMFYRDSAPADFNFSNAPMVAAVQPDQNPLGRTVCPPMTQVIYRPDEPVVTLGCHTPVRINGAHIGSIGTTMAVADYLGGAISVPEGSTTRALIITENGQVIAYESLIGGGDINPIQLRQIRSDYDLDRLSHLITRNGRNSGWIKLADEQSFVSYARMPTPGWYLIYRDSFEPLTRTCLLQSIGIGILIALVMFGLLATTTVRAKPTHNDRFELT